jgi:hypothetical protein
VATTAYTASKMVPTLRICFCFSACRQSWYSVCNPLIGWPNNRNPTLSYTTRLEQRVRFLEALLESQGNSSTLAKTQAFDHGGTSLASSSQTAEGSSSSMGNYRKSDSSDRSFRGLAVDDKGNITYHGTTSLFQLPHDCLRSYGGNDADAVAQDGQRRERLVANAWRQRALEDLSNIPVKQASSSLME